MRSSNKSRNGTVRCLLCFGLGYSARVLAGRLDRRGLGSARHRTRSRNRRRAVGLRDVPLRPRAQTAALRFRRRHAYPCLGPAGRGRATRRSIGTASDIAALPGLVWLGYLSTTGVYGDRGGGWVDEESELRPSGERGRRRVAAEAGWLDLWRRSGVPVQVFRLAAIYGPGRSPFQALRAGTAKRIAEAGAGVLAHPCRGSGERARRLDRAAASRRGLQCLRRRGGAARGGRRLCRGVARRRPPPLVPFEEAGLSAMARSFYDDNKRVSNARIKSELGVALRYPNYREGLAAILRAGGDEACPDRRHPASSPTRLRPAASPGETPCPLTMC